MTACGLALRVALSLIYKVVGALMSMPRTILGGDCLIVHAYQVAPEVAVEIPPHQVNVVIIVLGVVVFDQESLALHPVVMPFTAPGAAHPGEPDVIQSVLPDGGHSLLGKRCGLRGGHLFNERDEKPALPGIQIPVTDTLIVQRVYVHVCTGKNVSWRLGSNYRLTGLGGIQ